MSRRSRKKYERIHTRRAREGFPPVSRAILHRDGSISPRPPQHYNVVRSADFDRSYENLPPNVKQKVDQALEKLARNPYTSTPIGAGILNRLLNRIRWLKQELTLFSARLQQ